MGKIGGKGTPMMFIGRRLIFGVSIISTLFSMCVYGETVDQGLSKVSIVVDGMMKSKSGAT